MPPEAVSRKHAGAVTLLRTAEATGFTTALTQCLATWRKPMAQFDPGKITFDLAVSLALGGDCLANLATRREHDAVFRKAPSDPNVSRLINVLSADAAVVLTAIDTARATARAAAWTHAGDHAPDHDATLKNPIVTDLDATLVTAHSEKEHAAPTYKRGFGFHPLLAFVDRGAGGTGEFVAALLRPRQRRVEHRRRPHRSHTESIGTVAVCSPVQAGKEDPRPH